MSESGARGAAAMTADLVTTEMLLGLLEGATFANATRRNGRPCRIRLPDDRAARAELVARHVRGESCTLTFLAEGHEPWSENVGAVVLAAMCPGNDGRCRWIGIDLDASDHGSQGLADPVHAARVIAERADEFGLSSGVVVARSRRGRGRHVFLIPPEPAELDDAVVAVAALVAAAFRVAASDVMDYEAQHAFRRATGAIASPGDAGAVELVPRSNLNPPYGWALALPGAGAFVASGGGVFVDAFENRPVNHERVPRCNAQAWSGFIREAWAATSPRHEENPKQAEKGP